MIRLIGILTGSALAVAALIFAFGVPEWTGSIETPVEMTIAAPLPEASRPDIEREPAEDIPVQEPPRRESASPPDTIDTVDLAASDAVAVKIDEPVDNLEDAVPAPMPEPATAVQSQHWYAFWSPFRSELAADGFISELQRTTGLDYRVVKLKPGVYEVAFAYSDPIDRQDKLERISAATGLDMSGG